VEQVNTPILPFAEKDFFLDEFHSMELYPGIAMDPAIRFGKPCIQGTRIDVATVLGRFAAGDKIEEIQEDYQLIRDQIMAALAYATHVTDHLSPAVKSA